MAGASRRRFRQRTFDGGSFHEGAGAGCSTRGRRQGAVSEEPSLKKANPAAFISYVHADDESGEITEFRRRLEREVQIQTGRPFRIFQDRRDIQWGAAWQERIDSSLDGVTLLIPMITPSYFLSQACRSEFLRFLERERRLGRSDLILPVYYVTSDVVEDAMADEIAQVVAGRQRVDWRDLRFDDFASAGVARRIAEIAEHLKAAIGRSDTSVPAVAATPPATAAMPLGGIGLARVFDGFGECQDEILRQVVESRQIKLFVQMGKSVLSGSAIIYDALEHSRDDAEIKILHAGIRNPYLSERIALNRDSHYREWREDIQYATTVGRRLQFHLKPRLELREHSEGYVWRLFLFDESVYVQPYLYPSDNARRAPVLKFDRATDNSLYHMFNTYFDLKWEECAPTPTRLDDMVGAGDATAVAALVQRSGKWIFVIPKRFLELEGDELPFHSIGGKRQSGETWVEALQREAMEEVGSTLDIRSCAQTRDITSSAEFEPLQLFDEPQPYCVYKRTKTVDPEVIEPEVLWIVGFEANLADEAEIAPRSEIAAVVHLSSEMLRRTARERITYAQIRRAKDGSDIQVQEGVDFDDRRVAVPAGLAALPTLGASGPTGR
jgi:hypothetical protein